MAFTLEYHPIKCEVAKFETAAASIMLQILEPQAFFQRGRGREEERKGDRKRKRDKQKKRDRKRQRKRE